MTRFGDKYLVRKNNSGTKKTKVHSLIHWMKVLFITKSQTFFQWKEYDPTARPCDDRWFVVKVCQFQWNKRDFLHCGVVSLGWLISYCPLKYCYFTLQHTGAHGLLDNTEIYYIISLGGFDTGIPYRSDPQQIPMEKSYYCMLHRVVSCSLVFLLYWANFNRERAPVGKSHWKPPQTSYTLR